MPAQKTLWKDRRRSNGFSSKSTAGIFAISTSEPHISASCYCCGAGMLNLCRILSFLRRSWRRRSKSPVIIRQFPATEAPKESPPSSIRIATFNAAMFSMAPATPSAEITPAAKLEIAGKALTEPHKSILKRLKTFRNSKRRVSINLPADEICMERSNTLGSVDKLLHKGKAPLLQPFSFDGRVRRTDNSVLEVLKSVHADVFSLQNVKADEEKGMNPLADLADGLGMKYVFAESWAPNFGNAILSKWPIKQSRVQKICNDADFRNVLKATIEVPGAGEVHLYCTHLDHLEEEWRMKQIRAILGSSEEPHILAAGLNALDETDYSVERWTDITKYNEENGKPRPRADVMRLLKEKRYMDAKDFEGESEAVVVVAKGQDVQGTCKHGTRVDYILASPGTPYKFLPGSYAVMSSKGTSDHHIVKVDIVKDTEIEHNVRFQKPKKRLVKIERGSTTGIWKLSS